MARPPVKQIRRELRPPRGRPTGVDPGAGYREELPEKPGEWWQPGPGSGPYFDPMPSSEPLDWLGIPGLPADARAEIDRIFRSGVSDEHANAQAMAYLRTIDWYKTNYRGIGAGVQRGIIANEADYRGYVTQVQGLYRQYYGRDATGDEIETFLTAGYTPTVIGQVGAGKSYVDANRADIQYLAGAFTDEGQLDAAELTAYGEQQAGRGSALGTTLQQKMADAVRKVERVFQGQVATSPLALDSLTRQRRPDVGA